MTKVIIGAAAIAVMAAATVVWSKSLVIGPNTPAAKAQQTLIVSSGVKLDGEGHALTDGAHAEHAHGSPAASDRDYGWGPFRTADW